MLRLTEWYVGRGATVVNVISSWIGGIRLVTVAGSLTFWERSPSMVAPKSVCGTYFELFERFAVPLSKA